jgi:hypothetical protein
LLLLNSISLFYHNLSCDTRDTSNKPAGVIEDWTKAVVRSVTKSATAGNGRSATRPSATLVSKKSKKAAEDDARLSAYRASDDEHICIKREPAPSVRTTSTHDIISVRLLWPQANDTHLSP